jgi:hypothetical protein
MNFKLIILLFSSSQAILSLRLLQHAEERVLPESTDIIYHTNSYNNWYDNVSVCFITPILILSISSVAETLSSPMTSTITSSKSVFTSWPNSTWVSTIKSSIGTGSTKSSLSQATTIYQSSLATTTTKETTTYSTIPGKNSIPVCAYIIATDIGPEALCTEDYCNCDGTAAPLLTSKVSVSGIWTNNCAYTTQPATDACPMTAGGPLLPLGSVAGTVYVNGGVTTITL